MTASRLPGGPIGRRRDEIETPALILDLDLAHANIAAMAERMARAPVALRPHTKVHKSPQIARMQVDAGAIGVTTATASEAIAMAEAGIDDILIARQVVGPQGLHALAAAARATRITVAVDSAGNLDQISAAATSAGSTLGVIAEVDVGMNRCGVRSADGAVALARRALGLPGIEWRGAMGYEGHCMNEPDRVLRAGMQVEAMTRLLAVVDALAAAGIACEIVSAGGTGTYDLAAATAGVTESQAGSYVVMDGFHASLVDGFPVALTVLATVISRHGARVVLDAGRKATATDLMKPRVVGHEAETASVSEEHTSIDVGGECGLAVGDTVELVPGYAPTTVNLHAVYHVVRNDVVVDVWPVLARYGSDTAARAASTT
jgi:D-serine deaminase-like pyridoxal phosphate-dependent protein